MFSFELADEFISSYKVKVPPFGYRDAAGNSVGEVVFLSHYSRLYCRTHGMRYVDTGELNTEKGKEQCPCTKQKEQWWEVCQRVINGMYSLQKDHAKSQRLPWSDAKAAASAKEAFERLFNFKWTPPGRGLFMMGTPLVMEDRNSAALQNCAFVSTGSMVKTDPAKPYAFLMEASMLGVGVGFDDKGADKEFNIYAPQGEYTYDIPDSREGWVESTASLINAYLRPDTKYPLFNYEAIRPEGTPIRTFGGTAAGPGPLIKLHEFITTLFKDRAGDKLTRRDIADIGNLIGVCVVSGNVRRSAELLMGRLDDQEFLDLKNYEKNPERATHGWMSNNSVEVSVGQDLSSIIEGIALNGEPGVIWMDVSRKFGRLNDPENNKDRRVAGYNPCAEQSLESYECCTLVETYLNHHENLEDFKRTLKFAYLYAKTVTLLPTHWQETNAIMQRNRRIGASISGVANFADNNGWSVLRTWMDEGYQVIQNYDNTYSEWLGVRQSIKMTTVKPSGTVSILAGESPGVHWAPGGKTFSRAVRFSNQDPMLPLFKMAQYKVEPATESPLTTSVVFFPVKTNAKRAEKEVSIYEKVALAAVAQRYWSDNSVSVTVTFDAEKEKDSISSVLHMYDGQLKTVSFLPMGNQVYEQMPYTQISEDEYEKGTMTLFPIDLTGIYAGMGFDAVGESYCTTDACEVKLIKDNQ